MREKDTLIIFFSMLFLSLLWIAFNIYHNAVSSTVPQSLNEAIMPIAPDFDTKTLSLLKLRTMVKPDFTSATPSATIRPTISPTPSSPIQITPTPTITPTPIASLSPTASPSAQP